MRKGRKHYSYSLEFPEDQDAYDPTFPCIVRVLRHTSHGDRTIHVIGDHLRALEKSRPRRSLGIAATHKLVVRAKAAHEAGAEWPVPLEIHELDFKR